MFKKLVETTKTYPTSFKFFFFFFIKKNKTKENNNSQDFSQIKLDKTDK